MGIVLRLYINALLNGNPFVVIPTIIVAALVAAGPFHEGIASRDPWAIGLVALIVAGLALVLVVAIIDRRLNDDIRRKKPPAKVGRR